MSTTNFCSCLSNQNWHTFLYSKTWQKYWVLLPDHFPTSSIVIVTEQSPLTLCLHRWCCWWLIKSVQIYHVSIYCSVLGIFNGIFIFFLLKLLKFYDLDYMLVISKSLVFHSFLQGRISQHIQFALNSN